MDTTMKRKAQHYIAPIHYSQTQLNLATLRDLARDIRCARRDHCEANPLLGYAAQCEAEFRHLWAKRHVN